MSELRPICGHESRHCCSFPRIPRLRHLSIKLWDGRCWKRGERNWPDRNEAAEILVGSREHGYQGTHATRWQQFQRRDGHGATRAERACSVS